MTIQEVIDQLENDLIWSINFPLLQEALQIAIKILKEKT